MCGICGVYNFEAGEPVDSDTLRRMRDVMRHRGPDEEGLYVNGNVGLGHRRLSIIDLSTGQQPMSNEDGTAWIVYNGEVYNFLELRDALEKKGHVFRTRSDTEAIIHAYEEYGEQCVTKLCGMFALAIWDSTKRSLFLSRDRIGQKPLYYAVVDGSLVFSSEIKSILQRDGIQKEIDLEALDQYLSYLYVPAPRSIYRGIKKLPAGHSLICDAGKIEIKPYWDLDFLAADAPQTEEEYAEHLLKLITEAVKVRLVSEVPLGAFLSGGIDSSTVVGIMSQLMSQPVKTFAIGFGEKSHDELEYARVVAEHFGTDHHEFVVRPKATDLLPQLIWHFDEPFADSSAIPTYYVSKLSRDHVTVVLSGDGGDETFAGYGTYVKDAEGAAVARWLPRSVRQGLVEDTLLRILPNNVSTCPGVFLRKLKRYVKRVNLPVERRFPHRMCYIDGVMKSQLYSDALKRHFGDSFPADQVFEQYFKRSEGWDDLSRCQYADIKVYLPDDILVKVDRMSMAVSLEARAPFLDYKLLEFAARIPSRLKLNGAQTKYILKKTVSGLLPENIIHRKKKGFAMPIGAWLREDLKDLVHQILTEPRTRARGYFEQGFVERMLEEHQAGQWDWGQQLWILLIFELWHRQYVDK